MKLKLAVPNEEVKYIYENTIINWFREEIKKEDLSLLYRALEEGAARRKRPMQSAKE